MSERCIAIVGLPGAGKSSVGRVLAQRLARDFVDTDAAVESEAGMPLAAWVRQVGWPAFRECERRVLEYALERPGTIIATGGGAVESLPVRNRLRRSATVIWLQAPVETLLTRLAADPVVRPLLTDDPAPCLAALLRTRESLYAQVADLTVDTVGTDVAAVAARIVQALRMETT